ncbi:hypothetical protein C4K39_0028 [Pseudomonas sessilinigenes]|nr:hypothetical protein C4K39_0028 [Pseudomonas sessilinigenes]
MLKVPYRTPPLDLRQLRRAPARCYATRPFAPACASSLAPRSFARPKVMP